MCADKNLKGRTPGHRPWRLCALLGIGLVVISVAMANFPPYGKGDMRIFDWALVFASVLLAGVVLLLVALIGWLVGVLRRRSSSSNP